MADSNEVNDAPVIPANEGEQQADNVNKSSTEQDEKVLKQSDVNKIVGGAKIEAYERGKREAEMLVRKEMAEKTQDSDKVTLTKEEVRKLVQDESTAMAYNQRQHEIATQFVGKMESGIKSHDDFEQVVKDLDIPNVPMELIEVVTSMDNTAEIMYELGQNPTKFDSVLALSVRNKTLAHKAITKLSDSIKQNKVAVDKNAKTKVNEPLDQIKPSLTGTDSGDPKSVGDFRKQDWLRG